MFAARLDTRRNRHRCSAQSSIASTSSSSEVAHCRPSSRLLRDVPASVNVFACPALIPSLWRGACPWSQVPGHHVPWSPPVTVLLCGLVLCPFTIALRVFVSLSGKLLAEPKRTNSRVRRVFDDIVAPPLPLVRRFRGGKVSRKPLGHLAILAFRTISWITAFAMLLAHGRLGATLCLASASFEFVVDVRDVHVFVWHLCHHRLSMSLQRASQAYVPPRMIFFFELYPP